MDIEEHLISEEEMLLDVIIDGISIKEGLSLLRDSEAAVIALTASGFKQSEIAAILEISRTTVWNKNSSALRKLRIGIGQ